MKYFDRFKANVSHLTSKERVYQMDGNLEGKLVNICASKLLKLNFAMNVTNYFFNRINFRCVRTEKLRYSGNRPLQRL